MIADAAGVGNRHRAADEGHVAGFGLVDAKAIEGLESLNLFALGIIGFLVGGELHVDIFRKQGKQLFAILIFEGVGAVLLVGFPVTGILCGVTGSCSVSVAAGAPAREPGQPGDPS